MNKLRTGLRHLFVLISSALNSRERSQLLRLSQLLRTVMAAYNAGGLPALEAAIEPGHPPMLEAELLPRRLDQVEALAAVAVGSHFRTCLRRSALLFFVLRSAGQRPVLVIGVRRTARPSGLDGHAWVELDGQPFREPLENLKEMTVMHRYPDEMAKDA